jgi:hypothetical protein
MHFLYPFPMQAASTQGRNVPRAVLYDTPAGRNPYRAVADTPSSALSSARSSSSHRPSAASAASIRMPRIQGRAPGPRRRTLMSAMGTFGSLAVDPGTRRMRTGRERARHRAGFTPSPSRRAGEPSLTVCMRIFLRRMPPITCAGLRAFSNLDSRQQPLGYRGEELLTVRIGSFGGLGVRRSRTIRHLMRVFCRTRTAPRQRNDGQESAVSRHPPTMYAAESQAKTRIGCREARSGGAPADRTTSPTSHLATNDFLRLRLRGCCQTFTRPWGTVSS